MLNKNKDINRCFICNKSIEGNNFICFNANNEQKIKLKNEITKMNDNIWEYLNLDTTASANNAEVEAGTTDFSNVNFGTLTFNFSVGGGPVANAGDYLAP